MVGLALLAALLAIRSVVAAEERVLMEDFGVVSSRLLPASPPVRPAALPFPRQAAVAIDWRRALRKEHGTAFAAVTTALVLRATEGSGADGERGLALARAV